MKAFKTKTYYNKDIKETIGKVRDNFETKCHESSNGTLFIASTSH